MAEINPQNPIVTALIGLASGGTLAAIIARFVPSKKEKLDDATAFRSELRAEIVQMQARQDLLEKAVDDWQKKYWDLYADYAKVKVEHGTLQREVLQLQSRLGIAPATPPKEIVT